MTLPAMLSTAVTKGIQANGVAFAVAPIPGRFGGLPLKVVYAIEEGDANIITAFPFKGQHTEAEDAH